MLLKRTVGGYNNMIQWFGRPVPEICMVTNAIVNHEIHGQRVMEWNNHVLAPAVLEAYADAIYGKGAAL